MILEIVTAAIVLALFVLIARHTLVEGRRGRRWGRI
jgi:hypothetical protein